MSTNLNYKQVANVSRRTWDKEAYEKRAAQRQQQGQEVSNGENGNGRPAAAAAIGAAALDSEEIKQEFQPAESSAVGPEGSDRAFLKARRGKVEIDERVGTTELVSAQTAATTSTAELADSNNNDGPGGGVIKSGIGWHCKVCDCFLKDSLTYLDHINGRKHQRALGYTMRVERSTKDGLLNKLSQLTKQKEAEEKRMEEPEDELDFHDIVKVKDEEAKQRKEERARKRKERKQRLTQPEEKVGGDGDDEEEDEQQVEAGGMDPAMAAMMGFSGFGGGNKN